MPPTTSGPTHPLSPAQAADLAELVELEARWENLRAARARTEAVRSTTQDLHGMQQAYEAFRARLAAYNTHYPPGHIPELLLNTPGRLGLWCRRMRELLAQVEHGPRARCPVHLLAKAQRCAAGIAGRLGKEGPPRVAAPGDFPAALQELDALGRWCEELSGVEIGASPP
jgi:hypothetical protein